MAVPTRRCDIVMKGGITSGVVYPRAVHELSKKFRFSSIGGTSAGAIAAAGTAAAEYGRQNGKPNAFDSLKGLPDRLGEPPPGSSESRLYSLFQPASATRRLFELLMTALSAPKKTAPVEIAVAAMRAYRSWVMCVGVVVFLAAFFMLAPRADSWLEAIGVLVALLGLLALMLVGTVAETAFRLFRDASHSLPATAYGICTGNWVGDEGSGPPPLTPWLSEYLAELSGKPLLTFGDLEGEDACNREISLRMITTCLTLGRPYRLPFQISDNFWFKDSELEQLFSSDIRGHLVGHSGEQGPEGLRRLPPPSKLPIVFAARLSLSFPFLLSAVPLYSYDPSIPGAKPVKCWFSDGGISSNFPVHFFDQPLPRWPTFGINLSGPGQPGVWMPETNAEEPSAGTTIDGIPAFAASIRGAMQNWRDNAQARMPGYRDRIVHVRVQDGEGGLNLNMTPEAISTLANRGGEAGIKVGGRFTPNSGDPSELTWENHRWLRLRSSLAAFEELLERMLVGYIGDHHTDELAGVAPWYTGVSPPADQRSYRDILGSTQSYLPFSPGQADRLPASLEALADLAKDWLGPRAKNCEPDGEQKSPSFHYDSPRPEPELRIAPRI